MPVISVVIAAGGDKAGRDRFCPEGDWGADGKIFSGGPVPERLRVHCRRIGARGKVPCIS